MADEKFAYETSPQQVHPQSRQPVVAFDTSAAPSAFYTTGASNATQPIAIPGGASTTAAQAAGSGGPGISPSSAPIVSPSRSSYGTSYGKKTGTRSTFCPNTVRKGTKLTEEDYEAHERQEQQPTGWLQMLGLKKTANYGDRVDSHDEPQQPSYY
ncbi:hypothetical protein BGZ54_003713 [Gamsiella multidivaricata]|nr:hypothetical protein BGZ54_003713 [Gamsiella multidivaricata]